MIHKGKKKKINWIIYKSWRRTGRGCLASCLRAQTFAHQAVPGASFSSQQPQPCLACPARAAGGRALVPSCPVPLAPGAPGGAQNKAWANLGGGGRCGEAAQGLRTSPSAPATASSGERPPALLVDRKLCAFSLAHPQKPCVPTQVLPWHTGPGSAAVPSLPVFSPPGLTHAAPAPPASVLF